MNQLKSELLRYKKGCSTMAKYFSYLWRSQRKDSEGVKIQSFPTRGGGVKGYIPSYPPLAPPLSLIQVKNPHC